MKVLFQESLRGWSWTPYQKEIKFIGRQICSVQHNKSSKKTLFR